MAHNIPRVPHPVDNSNLENVWGETLIALADTEQVLRPAGGATPPAFPLDSGELVGVRSTSALDVGTALIVGLDKNFLTQTEEVLLNGTAIVPTTKQFSRINEIDWLETTKSQGTLTVVDLSGVKTYHTYNSSSQVDSDAIYTVPANTLWQAVKLYGAMTKTGGTVATGTIALYYRPIGTFFRRPFKLTVSSVGNSSEEYTNDLSNEVSGPADIYLTATSSFTGSEIIARLSILKRYKS